METQAFAGAFAAEPEWARAVRGLWERTTGGRIPLRVAELGSPGRRFEAASDGQSVTVRGTDAIAACVGIQEYLRQGGGQAVMWDTPLPVAAPALPDVGGPAVWARTPGLYYLNFCTFSYTTAYWDWPEWEREIDWMALHGVTMPLVLVGHDAVLRRVYTQHGMTDDEVRRFLGGPGYLPFVYMGNIDSFAGPLPESWIDDHLELGRRILERQRALGMTPVLPAFTGHVPEQLAQGRGFERWWQGMRTTVLDPDDPLFSQLAAEIVTAQLELFGTDHLYAADPFIEMLPVGTGASDDPAAVARAITAGLTSADPRAVWVLQSWPFSYQADYWSAERVQGFLAGVPDGRLLVLDLYAEADPQWERLDGFFGRPWFWGGLLNFGGRTEPVADLASADSGIATALESATPAAGLAITMEAIHVTPVFFELIADRAWSSRSTLTLPDWTEQFARHRYGPGASPAAERAWGDFLATLYSARAADIFPERFISIAVTMPTFDYLNSDSAIHADIRQALFYDPAVMLRAWMTLHDLAHEHPDLVDGPLGTDLAGAATAAMLRIIDHRFSALVIEATRTGGVTAGTGEAFLDLFDALDDIASTRADTRLGTWDQAARRWARDKSADAVLRDNARRILTAWNTVDNPRLNDYSARLWSGLIAGYYKQRWRAWLELLPAALAEDGRGPAQASLDAALAKLAAAFINGWIPAARRPAVRLLEISGRLIGDFGDEFRSLSQGSRAAIAEDADGTAGGDDDR